ncbi:MAG TPA: aspartate-semialdehyde dehydrogenase [Candidatus Desulfovibrio intestinipullorum]|uniref:Aspartate-semialdehyde dehydrogenase n=1 Tax=Candidatus Desulfovibrio intestinipullorum TaxID=2838536 RepID=A0A9D1TRB7_9BACT|nr:aspartate-semialdehyde dehydrogenase [Candidatus Desulfovibrio intestinipullorum]
MGKMTVAVCGATGAVGREMLNTLHQRQFPATEVVAFASSRSAGTTVPYGDKELTVRELKEDSFEGIDLALFSAGGSTSTKFAPYAAKAGCVVVDNSAAWRMDDRCPLVVPEVNPEDLSWHKGIIANPNCSTIQMLVALKPIYDAVGIRRIVVSTYQAVSGTGQKGIAELEKQVRDLFNGRDIEHKAYPYQIAFNILPHIDIFLDNDYTKEEMKMVNETRKMFHDPLIRVTATCARVPVFYGHAESVNIETEKKLTARECRALLSQAPGVRVIDNPHELLYPMPIMCAGQDDTLVGRIRDDESVENGLNLWVCADNIRKGAALNAVQIAEELIRRDLVRVEEKDRATFM